MSLDFPSTPTNGQIYNGFVWDDTAGVWKKQNNIKFYVGDTAPNSPLPGDGWFNSTTGTTQVYYDDGDTEQWVELGTVGPTGPTGPTGPETSVSLGTVTTNPPGGTAVVSLTGPPGSQVIDFEIPQGPTGPATSITIGSVSEGGSAAVSITGPAGSQVLSFTLPQGPTGPTGPAGLYSTPYSFNQKTSTSYSIVLEDAGKIVELSNSSAISLSIPLDSSINFPVGSNITILQTNTGQVTVSGVGGVTVSGTPGLKLRAQWSSATLIKRAANTWVAIGDLVP